MLLASDVNIEIVTQLITTVGFPIVVCLACMLYIKYIIDAHNKQIEDITATHKEEMYAVKTSLDNNTQILTRLYEKISNE